MRERDVLERSARPEVVDERAVTTEVGFLNLLLRHALERRYPQRVGLLALVVRVAQHTVRVGNDVAVAHAGPRELLAWRTAEDGRLPLVVELRRRHDAVAGARTCREQRVVVACVPVRVAGVL